MLPGSHQLMPALGTTLGIVLLLPVVAARLLFLAPTPLGWINYGANLVCEIFFKKFGWRRTYAEMVMVASSCLCLWVSGAPSVVLASVLALVLSLEVYVRRTERHLLTTAYTHLDRVGVHPDPGVSRGLANGYPGPSTHPDLTLNLIAPFVERVPVYHLGTLLVGREFEVRLLVGNHTLVPTQTAIRVRVAAPVNLVRSGRAEELVPRLGPGQVHELSHRWRVERPGGPGSIRFEIEWGHLTRSLEVRFHGCVPKEGLAVAEVGITRYPGACRSAFTWRGDMDLYDESTVQSIEGLEVAFGLGARYRMPQTMYLSTRLSIDGASARSWAAHYGCDRGAGRIPLFIEWMRDHVDWRHQASYPFQTAKRFVVELGNHGHLHFGTDTSGAPENGWKPGVRMGAGVYPWLGPDQSSFGEQRDNALEARRLAETLLGFTPRSWAMPDRTNDRHTAAAMEAAGCEVLSGSDTRPRENVLLLPPPHYSRTTAAVELTNRYPGDPQHVFHVAMVTFWMHRAHRCGVPMVFMCHQHMRQFAGHACARFTEHLLRYALTRFQGDLHVNTVFGIGKYWREVLGDRTRQVNAQRIQGGVVVENRSDVGFRDVPVDFTTLDGRRFTELVDLPAGGQVRVLLPGG